MAGRFTRNMANFIYSKKNEIGLRPNHNGYKGHWQSPREYDIMYRYASIEEYSDTDFLLVDDILVDAYQLAREGCMDAVREALAKAVKLDRAILENISKA